MSSPTIDPARMEALRQMLSAPNMRERLLPTQAAGAEIFSVEESLLRIKNIAHALHCTPRLLVDVTTTEEPDGSLTIRVTPQTTDNTD